MGRVLTSLLAALAFACGACAQTASAGMVLVQGGPFRNPRSNYFGKAVTLSGFLIGRCEVTQKEWVEVMGSNPSGFRGDDLPVETVTWYDCIEYCNRRSLREGLKPYYTVDKTRPDPGNGNDIDDVKWIVTINEGANGYRLPTEAEWEYAAGGGQKSQGYTYSGSDDVEKVAWYWQNSGDKPLTGAWSWPLLQNNKNRTKPVGSKDPNELGLSDMSGNVREWCWDWYGDLPASGRDPKGPPCGSLRIWRGGGWMGGDFCCDLTFRGKFEATGKGPDQGLRVCRNP